MLPIYKKALEGNCKYEHNCSQDTAENLDRKYWSKAKRANKKLVFKVACMVGLAAVGDDKYYNPYNAYRTDTHLIYVHSCIDYFIKVG